VLVEMQQGALKECNSLQARCAVPGQCQQASLAHLLGDGDEAGVGHPGAVVAIQHLAQLVRPHLVHHGLQAKADEVAAGGVRWDGVG
jgi:hypothetical protein